MDHQMPHTREGRGGEGRPYICLHTLSLTATHFLLCPLEPHSRGTALHSVRIILGGDRVRQILTSQERERERKREECFRCEVFTFTYPQAHQVPQLTNVPAHHLEHVPHMVDKGVVEGTGDIRGTVQH